MDWQAVVVAALAMAAGGMIKGATGAGAPLVVVPVLSLLYNVPFAVAVFSIPNIASNLWQMWTYRAELGPARLWAAFALGGAIGAGVGSAILANADSELLALVVAMFVLAYIVFRLLRPEWVLDRGRGERLAGPVGGVAGVLFGMIGLSAPVSITFLNALRLSRAEFIATVSLFFLAMGAVQVPTLIWFGILDVPRAALSLAATLPLFGAMPVGGYLARFLSPKGFDRLILTILGVIAVRIIAGQVL